MTPEEWKARIRELIANWPPFTEEQCARLVALLSPTAASTPTGSEVPTTVLASIARPVGNSQAVDG